MNINLQSFFQNIFKGNINCWTHCKTKGINLFNQALSYCFDCKIFLCDVDNCGKNHIFHKLENVDTVSRKMITPIIQKFNENIDKLENSNDNCLQELNNFKQQFADYLQTQSSKIKKQIEDINVALNEVWNNYNKELQELQIKFKNSLDDLQATLQIKNNPDNSYSLIHKIINLTTSQKSKQKEFFILQLINNFNELNRIQFNQRPIENNIKISSQLIELKEKMQLELERILEGKLIEDIRTKTFGMINYFYNNIKNINNQKEERIPLDSTIKSNKNLINSNKIIKTHVYGIERNIDLDIFLRNILSEINLIRNDATILVRYKQENNEAFNRELESLYNSRKAQQNLIPIEWDSDLGQAAEMYFKLYPNDHSEMFPFQHLEEKMNEIILNIYPFEKIETYNIISIPEEKAFISKLVFNWKKFKEIFLGKYNLIGMSALQIDIEQVVFLINISEFKAN